MRILLLEDDHSYRISIKELLESLDYEVEDFEDGESALDAVFERHFDLLLLDIRVPKVDGYAILKEVREAKIEVPIIFVTSLADINNLSLGYELGCNDYLRKPFSLKELKFRVQESIKRYHFRSLDTNIKLPHGFIYDIQKERLFSAKDEILLTQIEKRLLTLLVKNQGSFITVDQIREIVWDGKDIGEGEVRMSIKKLRDKSDKELIQNSRGLGYKIEKTQTNQ